MAASSSATLSCIDLLASIDWNQYRMYPTGDPSAPFAVLKTRLNITSEELVKVVATVRSLAKQIDHKTPDSPLRAIAEKCRAYILAQSPIHLDIRPYIPPIALCNEVLHLTADQTKQPVPIKCLDRTIEISPSDYEALRMESSLETLPSEVKVRSHVLLKIIADCSNRQWEPPFTDDRLDFSVHVNFAFATFLLGLDNLRHYYCETTKAEFPGTDLEISVLSETFEILSKDLSVSQEKVHTYYNYLIQYLFNRYGKSQGPFIFGNPRYLRILTTCPLKTFRFDLTCNQQTFEPLILIDFSHPNLQCLEEVEFVRFNITREFWEKIESLPKLRSVRLTQCQIDPTLFEPIGKKTSLTSLGFVDAPLTDATLAYFSSLRLTSFELVNAPEFTGTGLHFINPDSPEQLSHLIIKQVRLTPEGAETIGRFKRLEKLVIEHGTELSPLFLYEHLADSVQHLEHELPQCYVDGTLYHDHTSCRYTSAIIQRINQLMTWKIQGQYPSPRWSDFENTVKIVDSNDASDSFNAITETFKDNCMVC